MPRIARELSALEVSRLRAPGLVAVGGVPGLHLQVTPTQARSWILRVKVGTKRRDMGLGAYPGVTLAQAREKARQARERIEQGFDPVHERQRAKSLLRAEQTSAVTFEQAARALIESKAPEWRNAKHASQWTATLEKYAFPVIGQLHVKDVQQVHILQILEPLWHTRTETASRLRGRIEAVLDWARARGHRDGENPARWRGHLDKLLAKPSKVARVEHHPAIPLDDAHTFYAALQQREGMAARALEFALLTAARSGEVRGATWAEIDLDSALWTIPATRMKAGREHLVPLSEQALQLLRDLPRVEGSDFVFPGTRGSKLSDMSLSAVMRRMCLDAVPHGLRSTFRDWCGERTAYPRDLAEAALAHTIASKSEAAYKRLTMVERRRPMMDAWAKFLSTPVAQGNKVVPLARNAA